MAYISFEPSDYFNTVTWTGTSSSPVNVTGFGHNPDAIWNKYRSGAGDWQQYDAVRGATKMLVSNSTNAESTNANGVTAFISDGFTAGSDINVNGGNSVAWGWKAGGSGSSNSDGSITSTVSASTTSGFSIVKYTGTGANATVGTGLGVAPKIVLVKDLSASGSWRMYTEMTGNASQLALDQTSVADSGNTSMWNSTSPTTTTFSIGTHGNVNTSSNNYIAYCFAEKKGFSKIGSYTGNGEPTQNAPFIYTGFKIGFLLIKSSTFAEPWFINDSKRSATSGTNPNSYYMRPNTNEAEGTSTGLSIDLMSNGFKLQNNDNAYNKNGQTYIYLAIAEHSLVSSNGVPATAR